MRKSYFWQSKQTTTTYLAVKRRVCDGSHCASQARASGSTAPGKVAQDLTSSQHVGGATLCLREAFLVYYPRLEWRGKMRDHNNGTLKGVKEALNYHPQLWIRRPRKKGKHKLDRCVRNRKKEEL